MHTRFTPLKCPIYIGLLLHVAYVLFFSVYIALLFWHKTYTHKHLYFDIPYFVAVFTINFGSYITLLDQIKRSKKPCPIFVIFNILFTACTMVLILAYECDKNENNVVDTDILDINMIVASVIYQVPMVIYVFNMLVNRGPRIDSAILEEPLNDYEEETKDGSIRSHVETTNPVNMV